MVVLERTVFQIRGRSGKGKPAEFGKYDASTQWQRCTFSSVDYPSGKFHTLSNNCHI